MLEPSCLHPVPAGFLTVLTVGGGATTAVMATARTSPRFIVSVPRQNREGAGRICSHPSIFYTRLIQLRATGGPRGGWSLSQLWLGERRGSPGRFTWTGHRSITGPHGDKQASMLTAGERLEQGCPHLAHIWPCRVQVSLQHTWPRSELNDLWKRSV